MMNVVYHTTVLYNYQATFCYFRLIFETRVMVGEAMEVEEEEATEEEGE